MWSIAECRQDRFPAQWLVVWGRRDYENRAVGRFMLIRAMIDSASHRFYTRLTVMRSKGETYGASQDLTQVPSRDPQSDP
jgi:hypothetical protein